MWASASMCVSECERMRLCVYLNVVYAGEHSDCERGFLSPEAGVIGNCQSLDEDTES